MLVNFIQQRMGISCAHLQTAANDRIAMLVARSLEACHGSRCARVIGAHSTRYGMKFIKWQVNGIKCAATCNFEKGNNREKN